MLRNLLSASTLLAAIFIFFNWGCTKIDSTTLGSDLIPAVDNVHTFADTLDITTSQAIFDDTTKIIYSEMHPLGSITNDPVFGTTTSDLYLQLSPTFYPFYFGNSGDTITGFDSAVLCLSYKSFYGDTLLPQTLTVYEINSNTTNFKDSVYFLNFLPDGGIGSMLGSTTIKPVDVKRYTFFKGSAKDSINNQIRIPLDNSFLQNVLLANLDTSSTSLGIYRSDSLFKVRMKGFAIKASGGSANGLFYVDITDAATRLEVHYRKTNRGLADTSYSSFKFSLSNGQATHLERNRVGYPVSSPDPNILYLQTTPGTYAILNVPGLSAYDNRIIHRADIHIEQIPNGSPVDDQLLPPAYLYLDLVDTPTNADKYKPIYFDLNPSALYSPDDSTYFFPSGGIDFSYYGGYARKQTVGTVSSFYYNFNVSRYVQHIVTNHLFNYPFRLTAPSKLHYSKYALSYNNLLADGRVMVGSGTNPNYRMYMRVVYSKL